jgi:hypothetical protein
VKYYLNGKQVSSSVARSVVLQAFHNAGHVDRDEFDAVWNAAHSREECRDTVFEWSGYTVEMVPQDEDDALEE